LSINSRKNHYLFNLFYRAKCSSLYNNAFYLMLNTACTSVLGFVFWYVMARYFSSSDLGIGSALNSASGLVASFAGLGLGIGLVRFVPEIKYGVVRLISKLGEKSAPPRKGTVYHPHFVEYQRTEQYSLCVMSSGMLLGHVVIGKNVL
jgi:hypothetical protein